LRDESYGVQITATCPGNDCRHTRVTTAPFDTPSGLTVDYCEVGKGRSTIGGIIEVTEDMNKILPIFTVDWENVIIYNTSSMPCVKTDKVFADGQASLECDIFHKYGYHWWGAFFNPTLQLDRDANSYSHLRLKVKAADGYGKFKLVCGCERDSVSVHDPKYSPDGLSIDDLKWRTIYIPIEDLGLTGQIINVTTCTSEDVKPIKFYLDSIAFVKATSQVKPFTNFPIAPRFSTARTSGYTTFNIDNTIDPTVIEQETKMTTHSDNSAATVLLSLLSLISFLIIN